MYLNSKYREEHIVVVLENGIDFKASDCMPHMKCGTFVIKEDKLNSIAKAIGFDSCVRSNQLQNITQEYVNAEFVRLL